MNDFKNIHNKLTEAYFKDVVSPLLPMAEQGISYAFGNLNPSEIEISLNPVNGSLKNSQYQYNKKELKFIHYTKLKYATNIVEEGKLKMYSLASMKDPQELSYALNKIIPEKSDFTIDNYKEEVFIFSMNEFQKESELPQNWKDYGDCGCGVGIVLVFPKEKQYKWIHQIGRAHV